MEDGVYYMSHRFSTSYTVSDALTELIVCALAANEYVYIRMKRDSSSPPLPGFGAFVEPIIGRHAFKYFGQDIRTIMGATPVYPRCVVLYSDSQSMQEDHVSSDWIFPQIFDTVETWDCGTIEDAVQRIRLLQFKENGLPKALFIDFSAKYPPEFAFEYVWEKTKDTIAGYITRKEIDCIMINSVDPDITAFIKVLAI